MFQLIMCFCNSIELTLVKSKAVNLYEIGSKIEEGIFC